MVVMETYVVNLDLLPATRWKFLEQFNVELRELITCYLNDYSEAKHLFNNVDLFKGSLISRDHLEEIEYIASLSGFSANEVLVANLYYDILKFYFGCSAFSVKAGGTILHARNLDWHTDNNILGKYTMLFDFQKDGNTVYKTVGWPGFVGALSGTKPGKFSLTLNAVSSNDRPEVAAPVSFLLRNALEKAESFKEAKHILETTPIASDCLILLSGTQESEMVVVERTPRRYATRTSDEGFIVVTNDYKVLENDSTSNLLRATSCSRYDRVQSLLRAGIAEQAQRCMNILSDDEVKMQITVQQMVFNNMTGDVTILVPNC